MASPGQEPTDQLPTAHEYGQRSLTDTAPLGAGSASTAAPSQPVSVSPATIAATPSARHAGPLSPEQQEQQGRASQPDAAQGDATAAAAATAAASPPGDRVYAEEKASPIWAWKRRHLLLLLPALILSVVGLGLSGNAAARGVFHLSGAEAILAIPVPIYVLTIVFAIAEIAVRVVRKFKAGFHPAVHVGVWLICWLIYAGLIAAFAIVVRWVDDSDDDDDDDDPDRSSLDKRQFLAQFVFIILLFLNTFILFIMSCIDTSAYNAEKATPPATDDNGNALDPNHHEDRSWRLTKLIFNLLVIVFGVIGFAIGISMVRFQDRYYSNNIIFPACACALLIPILWAVAEVCFALTGVRRRFLQGVHPGAHVGMWLVSWLILAIVGGMLTTYAVYSIEECHDYRDNNMRRSVAVDGYALPTIVPVVDATIVAHDARQVGGAASTANLLATPTANPNGMNPATMGPTSSRVLASLPTTTTTPFGSDPDDQDPYEDPYYPYRPSSSSSSRPSSSRPSSSAYGSGSSYGGDSSDYPRGGYYSGGYDRDRDVLCSRAGVDGLMIATCVFMWIVFVFAFVLFVAGCSDTYLRNHLRNPVTVVYVPVGQPLQYAYPPPQPVYSGVPMRGGEKQAMAQGLPDQHQQQHQQQYQQQHQQQQQQQQQHQQQPPPAQGNVIEYYGSPH